MNSLFIYYSYTGNGDLIADYYGKQGYDLRKVAPKNSLPKNFFLGMMLGGMLAGIGHKAKLKDFNYDVKSYDEIVVGMPIWNGKPACPMNTVLKHIDFGTSKITFVLYSGGGSAPKTVERLKNKYTCKIIELKEPKKYKEELEKLA